VDKNVNKILNLFLFSLEMDLTIRYNADLLAKPEPEDDTSNQWWLTVKILKKLGFRASYYGKGIAVYFVGGHDDIIRDDDVRIETSVYDASKVVSFRNHHSDVLGNRGQMAFSLEMYANLQSYMPMFDFMPPNGDAVTLAKNYLFMLSELARETNVKALRDQLLRLV